MGKKVNLNAPPKQKKAGNSHKSSKKPKKNRNYAQNMGGSQSGYSAPQDDQRDNAEQTTNEEQASEETGENPGENNEDSKKKKRRKERKREKLEQDLAAVREEQTARQNLEDKVGKFALKQLISYYAGPAVGNSKKVDEEIDKAMIKVKKKQRLIRAVTLVGVLLGIFIIFFIINAAPFFFDFGEAIEGVISSMATDSYFSIDCQEVTVKTVDGNGNVTKTATYPLEDYIAGVVNGEVGEFQNLEVYKEFAIAARSYFVSTQSNCTVESSEGYQVFAEITTETEATKLIKQAVDETKGIILLDESGRPFTSEYDAFCYVEKNDDYYKLAQVQEEIPVSWVEEHINNWYYKNCPCESPDPNKTECYNDKGRWLDGGHGRGLSQWGSYYLATEKGYKYDGLLNFYFEDKKVKLSNKSFASSIANLNIKKTGNASYQLDKNIDSFLKSNNSSLQQYNEFISNSIDSAGYGTRAGVVAAAVSSINFLYDNFNTKLPYWWAGHYSGTIGIPSTFGNADSSPGSPSQKHYPYRSFDCSGFVNWAIENGGYKWTDTNQYHEKLPYCNSSSTSCVGQPGDLLDSPGHVAMIVSVDEANGIYYTAESTFDDEDWDFRGVIITTRNIHNTMPYVVLMEDFYNNASNVRGTPKPAKSTNTNSNYQKTSSETTTNVIGQGQGGAGNCSGSYTGKKYILTYDQKKKIAGMIIREYGGDLNGMKAVASQMANLYEYNLYQDSTCTKNRSFYEYITVGGSCAWYSTHDAEPTTDANALQAVDDVIINGNRTLPLYINEFDWFPGDIKGASSISDSNKYIPGGTKISNVNGATGTYYCITSSGNDANIFFYTAGAESYREAKGYAKGY